MSPRTGRPKLDDDIRKDIRLEIRLNQQQNELLKTLSEEYGISKTETIIKALNLLAEQK